MRYLSAQQILILHALVVDETGGSHGVRDISLLESIVVKPASRFGGKELYKGIFVKAAVLLEAIVNYHVFVNGNKRTGFVAAARFLAINGYIFTASNKGIEKTVVMIATKKISQTKLASWLKRNSKQARLEKRLYKKL